jgi:S-adenosylmethionine hydrolase
MLFTEQPSGFKIVVGKREITEMKSAYALGAPGEVFGILGSMGYLEIAANRAAAAQLLGVARGSDVNIILGEAAAAGNGQ